MPALETARGIMLLVRCEKDRDDVLTRATQRKVRAKPEP
jgi:hypothetical protein